MAVVQKRLIVPLFEKGRVYRCFVGDAIYNHCHPGRGVLYISL
jgi:hypothetical protein